MLVNGNRIITAIPFEQANRSTQGLVYFTKVITQYQIINQQIDKHTHACMIELRIITRPRNNTWVETKKHIVLK